jgi:hypothetical protein
MNASLVPISPFADAGSSVIRELNRRPQINEIEA